MIETKENITENPAAGNGLDPAVNGIDAAAERFAPQAATLAGDLRDLFIERWRNAPKSWAQMSEREQTDHAWAIYDLCKHAAAKTVRLIALDGQDAITVGLDEVSFRKDKIAAKLSIPDIDVDIRHQLVDAQGGRVLIVPCDPARFLGERAPVRVDKQQPDLPLGDAEQKIDADLETIIAGDASAPSAGAITDARAERAAAEKGEGIAVRAVRDDPRKRPHGRSSPESESSPLQ